MHKFLTTRELPFDIVENNWIKASESKHIFINKKNNCMNFSLLSDSHLDRHLETQMKSINWQERVSQYSCRLEQCFI